MLGAGKVMNFISIIKHPYSPPCKSPLGLKCVCTSLLSLVLKFNFVMKGGKDLTHEDDHLVVES
jgi:hypothetical protein